MDTTLATTVKRDSCPVRRSFVEMSDSKRGITPLASLLRTRDSVGGKGGGLRISLLMTLIWVNARPPHASSRVAAYWAELLGREDPRGEGARAVRDALHELDDRGWVNLRSTGSRTEIFLRNESEPVNDDGTPVPYTLPYGQTPYLQVPREFWTTGLVGELSGAGVAMYLCALALTRPDEPKFFISTSYFDEHYGISRSSRKRGLAELASNGVLTTEVEAEIDLNTFRKVRRNVYRITKAYRQPAAWKPEEESSASSTEDPAPKNARSSRPARSGSSDSRSRV